MILIEAQNNAKFYQKILTIRHVTFRRPMNRCSLKDFKENRRARELFHRTIWKTNRIQLEQRLTLMISKVMSQTRRTSLFLSCIKSIR